MLLEDGEDVLKEVELLVASGALGGDGVGDGHLREAGAEGVGLGGPLGQGLGRWKAKTGRERGWGRGRRERRFRRR